MVNFKDFRRVEELNFDISKLKEGLGKVFFLPVKTERHKIIKTKKLEALKIRAFEKGMSDAFIRDFS